MSEQNSDRLPEPVLQPRHRWSFSLIWLVPIVAALAGLVLVVRTYLQAGPTVSITFETADGLEAGKTEVRYKNVVVGKVRRVILSQDHTHILAVVDLNKDAKRLAVQDSAFWVERPRVSINGVSGIETLLSGAYIGVDIGTSAEERKDFTGLEKPPAVTHDMKGKRFLLHAGSNNSLALGSPVYYRRIAVGRVVASDLDPDGRNVTVQVFVDAPYDRFVTSDSRFWNASGVNLALNASGLKVNTQSLASVIAGGVAFQPMHEDQAGAAAPDSAQFQLYDDQATALAPPDGPATDIEMHFTQTTRGLDVGAPVEFRGINFGSVKTIELEFDAARDDFYTKVLVQVFPDRLGPAINSMRTYEKDSKLNSRGLWQRLVDRGLRAQLRAGNVLTGQLYITLDFMKQPPPAQYDPQADPMQLPTAPGSLEQLQEQLQSIVHKLDEIPFGEIGKNLNGTLKSANSLLQELDHDLAPQAKDTLRAAQQALQSLDQSVASPDAPLQQDAHRTLEELSRTAASFRALADYLDQHPEALIRGKSSTGEPAPDSGRKQAP
jgi:paraquat-inducible protein B